MPTADRHGVYVDKDGHRFRIRKGDELPAGATMVDDTPAEDAPAEAEKPTQKRGKGAAPEDRSRGKAPEDRKKR